MASKKSVKELQINFRLLSDSILELASDIESAQKDQTGIPYIESQASDLKDNAAKIQDIYIAISMQSNADAVLQQLETDYKQVCEKIKFIRYSLTLPPFVMEPTASRASSPTLKTAPELVAAPTGFVQSGIKLPHLELPTFSGDLSRWTAFYDLFISAVDSQPAIAPIQKFHYLKTHLQGEPLSLIGNLPLSSDNYKAALHLLSERYSQPRLISSFHVNCLLDLSPPKTMGYEDTSKFVSSIRENLAALRANNEPVNEWSRLLAFIFLKKLNPQIRTKFEKTLTSRQMPELEDLLQFLDRIVSSQQWQSLSQPPMSRKHTESHFSDKHLLKRTSLLASTSSSVSSSPATPKPCTKCKGHHRLYSCDEFKKLDSVSRQKHVSDNNICQNCLSVGHTSSKCLSTRTCRLCTKKHNTLLHEAFVPPTKRHSQNQQASTTHEKPPLAANASVSPKSDQTGDPKNPSPANFTGSVISTPSALLGTAIVYINRNRGHGLKTRAVLDGGSSLSYITDSCFRRLGLQSSTSDTSVISFGNQPGPTVIGATNIIMSSLDNCYSWTLPVLIVSNITPELPRVPLQENISSSFLDLKLADPDFYVPSKVDLLVGADLFPYLMTGDIIDRHVGPLAIHTHLGYVITGKLPDQVAQHQTFLTDSEGTFSSSTNAVTRDQLSMSLSKFWEVEEVPSFRHMSEEDKYAEAMYADMHRRDLEGRYIVPILFKSFPPILGDSYKAARRCYRLLQARLSKDKQLRDAYVSFMDEYLALGHMSPATPEEADVSTGYFIPHHGVLRPTSDSFKLRVVFNASKPTSLRTSLNSESLPGPTLQSDISAIITRSRYHEYIFTADIRHMFRQILILPEHRIYQKILWDPTLSDEPSVFILNTVTYGERCAPFLAIRTLKQLANDNIDVFPTAAKALLEDVYVDDFVTGASTLQEAVALKNEIIALLNSAGLELRKWSSNSEELLRDINPEHCSTINLSLSPDKSTIKILGLVWDPQLDVFTYKVNVMQVLPTKRNLLSEVAKIYDPLGWLSPVTFLAKSNTTLMDNKIKLG